MTTSTGSVSPRTRRVAALVAGCFVMENLDITIVSTSAGPLAAALGTTPASIGAVVSAYLVALAVALPAGAWLAARCGRRPVFLAAITVFTLASLGCAASGGLTELVVWRVVQGIGAAMMTPVGRLMVVDGAAKTDIPRLMAYVVWPGLVAPVVAPLVGALITTGLGWPWLFLINVPVGVLALVLGLRWIPGGRADGAPPPLDVRGLLLTAAGLGGLVWAAEALAAGRGALERTVAGAVALLALALLALAVRHLRRAEDPLVDLGPLAVPSFRATVRGGAPFWMVVTAVPFLLPLLLVEALGWDPVAAGAAVLAVFAGNIGAKPLTGLLIRRLGLRTMLLGAGLVVVATTAAGALVGPTTPATAIVAVGFVAGAARSVGLTAYTTLAYAELTGAALRHANTLTAVVAQTAMGLGVALAAVTSVAGAAVTGTAPDGVTGFHVAFVVLALLGLVAVVDAWLLARDAGDQVRTPVPARRRRARSAVSASSEDTR